MNAILERKLPEDHSVIKPNWLPFYAHPNTLGFEKKEFQQLSLRIFTGQEQYDNIKTEGTELSFPEEGIHLERFNSEILNIRTDVATLKTDLAELKVDVSELKTDVAVLKTEVKHITENTQKVPDLVTDVAVIKTEISHMRRSLDLFIGIFIALFATVVGGILVWFFTQG